MSSIVKLELTEEELVQARLAVIRFKKIYCKFCDSSHNPSYDRAHKTTDKHIRNKAKYIAAREEVMQRASITASSSSSLSDVRRENRQRLEDRSREARLERIEEIREDVEMKDEAEEMFEDMGKLNMKE